MFEHAEARGIHSNVVEILSRRKDLQGLEVIDLACGDGRTTHFLRSRGATVKPFDLFPEAYKLSDTPGVADLQAPTDIPGESADLVVPQEVLEHLPNQLFAIQEMHRMLKPGGQVFLTTPSRSSLASKLSFLFFESETMKLAPWGARNSIWGTSQAPDGKVCYGHVWLVGLQQLRTMALLAGFRDVRIERSEISKSSVFLMLFFYVPLLIVSARAAWRSYRKADKPERRAEIVEQFRLNINPINLTNKFLIAVLQK